MWPSSPSASPPQADRRSSAVRKDAAAWEHLSNQEIRDTVLYEALPRAEKLRVNLKRAFAFVLPRYDDLTLFAFGIAFVLPVLLDPGLRGAMAAIGTDPHSETETLLLGFAGLGLTLSLIGVVWPREKSEFEKVMMLFFAILITIGAGVSTWRTPGAGALGWLAVFPIWNQFNAVLLLLLASTGILDTDASRTGARQLGRSSYRNDSGPHGCVPAFLPTALGRHVLDCRQLYAELPGPRPEVLRRPPPRRRHSAAVSGQVRATE